VKKTNTLIIGASMSGLASAASLRNKNIDYIIIEKENQAVTPWRKHYDRLHLHTSKRFSHLPFKKFGKKIPRYPNRQQVIEYLEEYQKAFNINPFFNTKAISVRKEGESWVTKTSGDVFESKYLIMATGAYGNPRPIHFSGLETFAGRILHSYEYKSGKEFQGQHVLVVGFGNSACEIAIDLYEEGSFPSMSVRSPVNVIPRDILGIPVQEISIFMRQLPPRVTDIISRPLINLYIGDLSSLGLKKMSYGALEEISRDGNAPVLDIGTIQHIRKGHIKVFDDIDRIEGNTIYFKDGRKGNFNAIVAGIGYYRDYAEIVEVDKSRFEDLLVNTGKQKYFGKDGLYFCGYWVSTTGQIREIAMDAKRIAEDISNKESQGH